MAFLLFAFAAAVVFWACWNLMQAAAAPAPY